MLPDDSSVPLEDRQEVARLARLALMNADALGVFPTPVDDIMAAAKIEVVPLHVDEGHIAWLRRRAEAAGQALLSALSKIWGVLDPQARIAYIDPETPSEKLPFLKLHEGGHALLPWQSVFGHIEDCQKTLAPEIKDEFERQANVFASDALFQIDGLARDARDLPFGMKAVLSLAKRYGASVYSTARRYAATHERACALVVLDPFQIHPEFGAIAMVRRVAASRSFTERFGGFAWPEWFRAREGLGRLVPTVSMTRAREFSMVDANGIRFEFVGEAFRTSRHVFVLIYCIERPIQRLILPRRQLILLQMSLQITAYLPSDDAEAFLRYSNSLGIDKSSLANLLVVRELRLNRLGSLSRFRHSQPSASCIKVTAHLTDPAIKDEFTASATRHELRPGAAAAMIFLAELEERWLERSLNRATHVGS